MVLCALCTDGIKEHLKIEKIYELEENDNTNTVSRCLSFISIGVLVF